MISAKHLPPPPDTAPIRTALLSVFDKTGLIPFAQSLAERGISLISTGGTARILRDAGIAVRDASEVTGAPEILDGRVKTLHPAIHGGLLARRTDPEDLATLAEQGYAPIDLVVVNLYPFERATAHPDVTDEVAAENIDIGGPTMVRAAAKNFAFVTVVTSPNRYADVLEAIDAHDGCTPLALRRSLAHEAFTHTAAYDAAISAWFSRALEPSARLPFEARATLHTAPTSLRYGENPHQSALFLAQPDAPFTVLHGKELSYNNVLDLSAALHLIEDFRDAAPTLAILKHTNPCGVASANTLADAYDRAFSTDRQSPFGGIVVVNRPLDLETARKIDQVFTELVIAPGFEEGVLPFLQQKANRRVVLAQFGNGAVPDIRSVAGGVLVQERDAALPDSATLRAGWRVVTDRQPTAQEWDDLEFAWRIVKHVKSNAIVYVREGQTVGIGAGQMSRVDSAEIAVSKGRKSQLEFTGSVVSSDAFFPFADGLLEAAAAGVTAVIQPGGSVRDAEVIAAANEKGLAMVVTGTRHFRH